MTRWLLLLFVFMLPAQFAWSAAAAYCGHESAPAASHPGHHSHEHSDADLKGAAAPINVADFSAQTAHSDCGYCHSSVSQISIDMVVASAEHYSFCFCTTFSYRYSSRIEPDIERPKWLRASSPGARPIFS